MNRHKLEEEKEEKVRKSISSSMIAERAGGPTVRPRFIIMILFDRRRRVSRHVAHLIPVNCIRDLRRREGRGEPICVSPRNNNILNDAYVYVRVWRSVLFGEKIGRWYRRRKSVGGFA
jgi:hypothetical protein